MKRAFRGLRLLLAFVVVATCSASAQAADDVYPFDKSERLGAVHKIVQDIDQSSFGQAVGHYPTSGAGYTVDFGPYMMWQIVTLFESGARVEGLRLAKYAQQCRTVQAVASNSVACAYESEIVVRAGGQEHRSRYHADGDVGRVMEPSMRSFKEVVGAELREQVDGAVARFKQDMTKAGVLPAN